MIHGILPLFALGTLFLTVVALGFTRARRALTNVDGRTLTDPRVLAVLTSARRRMFMSVGSAMAVFVACFAVPPLPGIPGIPQAVAPLLAASAGLLLYTCTPPKASGHEDAHRSASLVPRYPWTFASWRMAMMLALTVVLLIALLVFAGTTASDDDQGRWSRAFSYTNGEISGLTSPYPGWYYGLPIIGATALLAAATVLALHRVASTPSLPGRDLEDQNRRWGTGLTRVIVATAETALLFQLGGVAFFMALSLSRSTPDTGSAVGILALSLFLVAAIALVGSVVGLAMATFNAAMLPAQVTGEFSPSTGGPANTTAAGNMSGGRRH